MIVYRQPALGGCLLWQPSIGLDAERVCRLVTDSAMASVYGIDAAVDDPECEMTKITEALRDFAEPLLLPGGYILEIIHSFSTSHRGYRACTSRGLSRTAAAWFALDLRSLTRSPLQRM